MANLSPVRPAKGHHFFPRLKSRPPPVAHLEPLPSMASGGRPSSPSAPSVGAAWNLAAWFVVRRERQVGVDGEHHPGTEFLHARRAWAKPGRRPCVRGRRTTSRSARRCAGFAAGRSRERWGKGVQPFIHSALSQFSPSVQPFSSALHCLAYHKASFRRHEGRSRFFHFFDIRPLRGGAGRGSNTICRFELDVRFFFRPRSELGGPSVAVRGGVQLGGVCTSSMSRAPKKISKAVPLAAPNG